MSDAVGAVQSPGGPPGRITARQAAQRDLTVLALGCNIFQQLPSRVPCVETTMKVQVIWDLEDDPRGNFQHIAEHDVTPDEVEEVLNDRHSQTAYSESSGRPITFGWTVAGRYLAVIWELVDKNPLVVYPVTAYEAPEPRRRRRR